MIYCIMYTVIFSLHTLFIKVRLTLFINISYPLCSCSITLRTIFITISLHALLREKLSLSHTRYIAIPSASPNNLCLVFPVGITTLSVARRTVCALRPSAPAFNSLFLVDFCVSGARDARLC